MIGNIKNAWQKERMNDLLVKAKIVDTSLYQSRYEENYKHLTAKLYEISNSNGIFGYDNQTNGHNKSEELTIFLGGKEYGRLIVNLLENHEFLKIVAKFKVGSTNHVENYRLEPDEKNLVTAYSMEEHNQLISEPALANEQLIEQLVIEMLDKILSHY